MLVGVARPRGRGRVAGGHSMLVGGMSGSSSAVAVAVAAELDGGPGLFARNGRAAAAVVVVVRAERRALFSGAFVAGDPRMEWPLAWQRQQFREREQSQDGRSRRSEEKANRERKRSRRRDKRVWIGANELFCQGSPVSQPSTLRVSSTEKRHPVNTRKNGQKQRRNDLASDLPPNTAKAPKVAQRNPHQRTCPNSPAIDETEPSTTRKQSTDRPLCRQLDCPSEQSSDADERCGGGVGRRCKRMGWRKRGLQRAKFPDGRSPISFGGSESTSRKVEASLKIRRPSDRLSRGKQRW